MNTDPPGTSCDASRCDYAFTGADHGRKRKKSQMSDVKVDKICKARSFLADADPDYKDFLLARAATMDEVQLRKQAMMFSAAIKPTIDKLAAVAEVCRPV